MKKDQISARFEVGDILPLALTIVVTGIGVAYGLNVLSDVKDDMGDTACDSVGYWNTNTQVCQVNSTNTTAAAANPAEFTATASAITAVAKFPSKLGLIVTVIVAAILIGILVRYLMVR